MKEVAEKARKEAAKLAGKFSLNDISFIARVNVRRWTEEARKAENEAENAENENAFTEALARYYIAVSMVDRWEQVKTAANAD